MIKGRNAYVVVTLFNLGLTTLYKHALLTTMPLKRS